MVLIVSESWWPAGKSAEVGKMYIEIMKKYPNDKSISKPLVLSSVHATKEGYHAIGISSIKPGKVKEALDIGTNRLLMISAAIEGYRYELYVAYDLVEAMPLVGLQAPE
jgi:hypothetical protein